MRVKSGCGSFSVNMLSSRARLLVRLLTNKVALHDSRNLTPARAFARPYPGNCRYVPVNSWSVLQGRDALRGRHYDFFESGTLRTGRARLLGLHVEGQKDAEKQSQRS